jgi:hypothetical protein
MKTAFRSSAFVLVLLLTGSIVHASSPLIQGRVSGVELCPQTVCEAAIFTGVFQGRIGLNPFAVGSVTVAIKHQPLPEPGHTSAITGGQRELQTLFRRYSGDVDRSTGTIRNNGDLTFHVFAVLVLTDGGSGAVRFDGTLHHDVFPPTVDGIFY